MLARLLFVLITIYFRMSCSFSKNAKTQSKPGGISKGFGSSNTKPISKPALNPLASLETSIQDAINQCAGLREAMALVDEIEAYELKMKLAYGMEKIQFMQTYAQDIENKRKLLEKEGFKGWKLASIRNKLQEITWDNTASIRELRHKEKSSEISSNVRNHMLEVARYALHHDLTTQATSYNKLILDVGCGTGITFQFIKEYLTRSRGNLNVDDVLSKCHGVDISNDMVQICRQNYPTADLQHIEYSAYNPSTKFSSIVFNECVHNFPNIEATLTHACSMLSESDGRIILSHPRGYENVLTQRSKNKWLSPSLLPNEQEVKQLADKLALTPAVLPDCRSPQYLAVLMRK
jgi:2-polyprenyl-3-methyl-5-hydroxy-6-metoxy-1,4-benzoquinol methylase